MNTLLVLVANVLTVGAGMAAFAVGGGAGVLVGLALLVVIGAALCAAMSAKDALR